MKDFSLAWSTNNEKAYIDTLVSGSCLLSPVTTPEERLRNYIVSAHRRMVIHTFGDVSGMKVIQYAREKLNSLDK